MEESTLNTIVTLIVALIGAALSLTATQEAQASAGFLVLVGAIIAKVQHASAIQDAIVATDSAVTANNQVDALIPGTPQSNTPSIVATLPSRSWKMSPETRNWLTFDATPANAASINKQIDAAEEQHLTQYQITFDGGYYNIQYGLQYGGAGNPSGKA